MGGSDYKQSTPSNSGKRHQGLRTRTYRRGEEPTASTVNLVGKYWAFAKLLLARHAISNCVASNFIYGFSRCQDARIQG